MNRKQLSWPLLSGLAGLLAAVLGLSILLNLEYPAENPLSWQLLLPSIDVWLLLLPLALAAHLGSRFLFWTIPPIWMLFLVLRLIRIGDTVVPMYFDRPFNLYIDSGYLFGLYDLLTTSSYQGDFLWLVAVAATAALGGCLATWYGWRLAARAFAVPWIRSLWLAGSGLLLGGALILGWQPAKPPALVRLAQEILSIRLQIEQQQVFVSRLEQTAKERTAGSPSLRGLEGADVLLFIVESYGRIALTHPKFQQGMTTTLDRFGRTLAQHGFEAVSSYLESPTYGGSSWLAHGTLESGVRIGNDLEDAALLRSSLPPMASYFRKNGYRTVSVMPGTRFPFPQGEYFDFEQVYYAPHFDYRGPPFGWASMPDQFVLDWVQRREFRQRKQPLFACYVLISSHAAFNIQPHYIPDWDAIGDGSLYHERDPIYFPFYWRNLKDAGDAYLHSLDYEFTTLGDYLARYVRADTLIIILGDHQPPAELTGTKEPWSVPIHIISRNPRLLHPFRTQGYTPGLIPNQPLPHAGMETFLPRFLENFR